MPSLFINSKLQLC